MLTQETDQKSVKKVMVVLKSKHPAGRIHRISDFPKYESTPETGMKQYTGELIL